MQVPAARAVRASLVATGILLTAACSGPDPVGTLPTLGGRGSIDEGSTVSGSGFPSLVFTDSTGVTTNATTESFAFSYPVDGGVAMRDEVPVEYPTNLTDQAALDTLDYYLPSTAHQVGMLADAALYPPGDTTVVSTLDPGTGSSITMKITSGRRPNGSSLPCLDAGCPPGRIAVYDNNQLVSLMLLDWNVLSGGYTLKSTQVTIYDPEGTVRANAMVPVSYTSAFASAGTLLPRELTAPFWVTPAEQFGAFALGTGIRVAGAQTISSEECRRAVRHAREAAGVARTAVRSAAQRPSVVGVAVAAAAVAYAAAASVYAAHACAPPGAM